MPPYIPVAARATCRYCCGIIDIGAATTYQRVTGWAKNRAGQGGTNAIALRQPLPEWACRECVDRLTSGIAIEQATLFSNE